MDNVYIYIFRDNSPNRVFSRPEEWPVVNMETVGQTNQRTVTAGARALSTHYIMLIRALQALPLVRIYFQIYSLNARHVYIFMWNTSRKGKQNHRTFLKFKFFLWTST